MSRYPGANYDTTGSYQTGQHDGDDLTDDEFDKETCCFCKRRTCQKIGLAIICVVVIIGIVLLAAVPAVIDQQITSTTSIANPQAPLYKTFVNASSQGVVVENIYYFFNCSNAHEVETSGAKPVMTSHGPYVYRHVKWHPEEYLRWFANATLHYKSLQRNTFMPEKSCATCTEQDYLTTARAGVFGAIQKVISDPFLSGVFAEAVQLAEKNNESVSFFHTRTVSELIHGYNETLIYYMQQLVAPLDKLADLAPLDYMVGYDADVLDASQVGYYGIYSGGKHSATQRSPPADSFASYTLVNGQSQLDYWNSSDANTIRGTDATFYPPFIMHNKSRHLYAYVTDIKRSVELKYTESLTNFGINVQRYKLADTILHPCSQLKSNCDYFIYHQGIQPAAPVKHNKPDQIFAGVTKWYYLDVTDMTDINVSLPRAANPETDDIYLDFEPVTSALIEANKRLQINFRLRSNVIFSCRKSLLNSSTVAVLLNATKNLPETWIPAFATNEYGVLPAKDQTKIKSVLALLTAMLVLGILFTAGGGILLLSFGIWIWRTRKMRQPGFLRMPVPGGVNSSAAARAGAPGSMASHDLDYGSVGGGLNRSRAVV